MKGHAFLALATLTMTLAGSSLVSPAGAQATLPTDAILGARSFVRDSVSPVRALAVQPGVISLRPSRPATALTPAALNRPLVANEIRVKRVSAVAAMPVLRGGNLMQWSVPLEIQARDRSGVTRTLKPRMEMLGDGLVWNRTAGRYLGRVRVWLEDNTAPSSGYPLEAPVAIEIGGEASDYDPSRWNVSAAGLPSRDVDIAVAGARTASAIQVKVAATSSSQQTTLEASTAALTMPLSGEPMIIRPARQAVQGWGLEMAEMTITTSPSKPDLPLQVSVTSARGTPRAQTLAIDASGQAIARIRSGTPGRDTLWVNLENRYTRFALVDHQPPWMFLVWALGGGLLGSLLRTLGTPRGRSSHPARRFVILQVVGVLCGLLTMGLYQIGFPILPSIATGQTGGFVTGVIAAVGAFLGRDWLAERLGEK